MARKPHFELGARIHSARVRRGFSFAQLAAYVGVTEISVRAWESGQSRPNRDRLVKIAEGLGVSETLLACGGLEWDEALVLVKQLSGPDVFQWPTLYPAESRTAEDGEVEPFRIAPGVQPDAPDDAPARPAPPVRAARTEQPTKVDVQALIAQGRCCGICRAIGQNAHAGASRYCRECVETFSER